MSCSGHIAVMQFHSFNYQLYLLRDYVSKSKWYRRGRDGKKIGKREKNGWKRGKEIRWKLKEIGPAPSLLNITIFYLMHFVQYVNFHIIIYLVYKITNNYIGVV